jgi:DNA helicase-2/ATP-dependent DNA helicase PcrA
MVNFDKACGAAYAATPHVIDLASNYRSHADIIDFFNTYVTSFPVMLSPGARAPGKSPIVPAGPITGSYPAVMWIHGRRVAEVAQNVARFVADHLMADGVISDFSQCAILFRSTKESARNAGPFAAELRAAGIPIYNPRSKTFMDTEEVQFLLGLLVALIDPGFSYRSSMIRGLPAAVDDWLAGGAALSADPTVDTSEIEHYMTESERELRDLCARRPDDFLDLGLLEIAYRILSREPFPSWRQDPVRNMRLAKVTRLLESYHSIGWDQLRSDSSGTGLAAWFTNRFYNEFIAYLLSSGVSDEEDDEEIVPLGSLPLMTIHQAKGLEFPVVIVVPTGASGGVGASQILEHELAPYRHDLYTRVSAAAADLAEQDDVRLLYVAYSRAQWALAIAGTRGQVASGTVLPGGDFTTFRRNYVVYP